MVESPGFTPTQIGSLFIFLAQQLAKRQNTIFLNNMLFDQIIEFLTNCNENDGFEERQQSLLDLLQTEGRLNLGDDKILDMAEKAKFYRICEYIHIKNKNWGQILCCYLKDPQKRGQIYSYINQILKTSSLSEREKNDFIETVFANMKNIIEIDSNKAGNVLLDYINNEKSFEIVLNSLENEPKTLYKLLRAILLGSANKRHKRDPSTGSINLESLSIREQRKQTLISDSRIQEKLIELMCQIEPNAICNTLKILEFYRIDIALVICKQYKINNATAYLLEINGNYKEAFDLLFNELNHCIEDVNHSNVESVLHQLKSKITVLIEFCQRCSSKMESEERETFWFTLLELMVTTKQTIKAIDKSHPLRVNFRDDLKDLTDKLLNGMIGNINLLSLLQRIINDPLYSGDSGGQLCDIRELLMGMLETYNYEETLLQTTNNMLLNELHQQLSHLRTDANKAQSNRSTVCSICTKPLYFEDNVVLFKCSHSCHEKCLDSNDETPKCQICNQLYKVDDNINKTVRRINSCPDTKAVVIKDRNIENKCENNYSLKLDESQINALECLRRGQKIDSRAHILNQLPNTRIKLSTNDAPDDDIYTLNLAPQWKQISQLN